MTGTLNEATGFQEVAEAGEAICINCWHFVPARHEQRRGKCCVLGTREDPGAAACEHFENRHVDESDSGGDGA